MLRKLALVALFSVQCAFAQALPCEGFPSSPAGVLEKLQCLEQALPEDSGFREFNYLYMAMTRNVIAALDEGLFEQPEVVSRFVAHFAAYYFVALDSHRRGRFDAVFGGWRVMSVAERRGHRHSPLQDAMAGMFVHIGRDLPLTVSDMHEFQDYPTGSSAFRRDYLRINGLVEKTFAEVRDHYFPPRCVDHLVVPGISDAKFAAIPAAITALREKSWLDGRIHHSVRPGKRRRRLFEGALDVAADSAVRGSFAGRLPGF